MSHPAQKLGSWLREHRQSQHIVARVFAGQIDVSPAEYAEVEHGLVKWLGPVQEKLIPEVLQLSPSERKAFAEMLTNARQAEPLKFDDVFSREQLEPVRLRSPKKNQLTAETKKAILNAVFSPLQ